MKIYNEKFEIESNKINKDYNLCCFADIHVTKALTKELFEELLLSIYMQDPDAILIPGDIISDADTFLNVEYVKKIRDLFKTLGSISDTFVSLGNHDIKKGKTISAKDGIELLKQIESGSVYVLDNKQENLNDDISITGFSPREKNYYYGNHNEWTNYFIEDYSKCDFSTEENKYNILLCHSPESIIDVINNIQPYDLILSGHNHDGLVPRFLQKIGVGKNDMGYTIAVEENNISKLELRTLPYCRGMHNVGNSKLIITRGLRKWVEDSRFFDALDSVCAKDITSIKLTKHK